MPEKKNGKKKKLLTTAFKRWWHSICLRGKRCYKSTSWRGVKPDEVGKEATKLVLSRRMGAKSKVIT